MTLSHNTVNITVTAFGSPEREWRARAPDNSTALRFFADNFIVRHGTLRMPPALEAKVADHWRTDEELAELVESC